MTDTVPSKPVPPVAAVTHLDALPAGTRLGEFEITALLGVGGFGMVYQAFDHSLQRDVAIKEYMPAALARRAQGVAVAVGSSVDLPVFSGGLKSFIAEARLLAQFDHPSLVKVFRFWEENNTAYMVMPLYRGITLKQARSQMRCPPPELWWRKLLWSILGALKVLHNGNTMHRDISPENIFLQDMGPPVLLDLGAARRAISEKEQHLTATLKYSYAPIEQYGDAAGLRQGPWTDLYALASVVHACVSNELPLPATLRVVRDRMPSFAAIAKRVQQEFGVDYSAGFVATIDQALAVSPADRPRGANSFARVLDLQTPSGSTQVDGRAELGESFLPVPAIADPNAMAQATTVAAAAAKPVTVPAPTASVAPPLRRPGSRAKPRWGLIAAIVIGVALAAAAGLTLWSPDSGNAGTPAPRASSDTVTPPARPTTAAQEAERAASAALPVMVASSASLPASNPAPAASGAEPFGSRASSTEPVPATVRAASGARPLRKPERPKPAPAAKASASVEAPVPASLSNPPVAPTESAEDAARKAAVKPAAAVVRTPEIACADRNFLTRPLCIFEQCKTPAFASLPVCVENARQLRDARNRND